MAYEDIGGKKTYIKFKECKVDQILVEGTFAAEVQGKYGVQFEFNCDDGRVVVLNGSGQLKHKMQWIREGDKVRVTYMGEELLTTGPMSGKYAHQTRVQKDTSEEVDAAIPVFGDEDEDTGLDEFNGDDDLASIPFD